MKTWNRRIVSFSVLFLTAALNTLIFPLIAFVLLLYDLAADRRLPLTRAYILVAFYLVWECAGILGACVVWVVFGWRGRRGRAQFLEWNYALQRMWTTGFTRVGIALFSLRLDISGDYAFGERSFVLLARHTSLADTILLAWFVLVRNRVKMRYVMKKELLWDPCLDIVGNRLPNYFIDRQSRDSAREVQGLTVLAEGLGDAEGIVLYPEGTRFSEKKRARALARLKELGGEEEFRSAERMTCVLPPRLKGAMTLLKCTPQADVVFFAHDGFEGASSFAEVFRGSLIGRTIHARFWAVPASAVPREPEAQKAWLYTEWEHLDRVVARWRGEGVT